MSGVRLAAKEMPHGPANAVLVAAVAAIHGPLPRLGGVDTDSVSGWPDSARDMSGAAFSVVLTLSRATISATKAAIASSRRAPCSEDVGLRRAPIETLQGGDARINARILTDIFAGERSPRRDVVLLNAAAVLVTADLAPDLPTGIALAAKTIDSGAVTKLVTELSNPAA